jgi:hypothetical protein
VEGQVVLKTVIPNRIDDEESRKHSNTLEQVRDPSAQARDDELYCEPVLRTVLEERASACPGQHARHRWPHKVRAGLA